MTTNFTFFTSRLLRIYPCGFALQLARSYPVFLRDGPQMPPQDRALRMYACHPAPVDIYIYMYSESEREYI